MLPKARLSLDGSLVGEISGSHLASLAYVYEPESFHDVVHTTTVTFGTEDDDIDVCISNLCQGKGLLRKIELSSRAAFRLDANKFCLLNSDAYNVCGLDFGNVLFDLRRLDVFMILWRSHTTDDAVTITVTTKDRDDLDVVSYKFFESVPQTFDVKAVPDNWTRMHDVLGLKQRWCEAEFHCWLSTKWFNATYLARLPDSAWCRWCKKSKREKQLANVATKVRAHLFLGGYVSREKDWIALELGDWKITHHKDAEVRTGEKNEMPLSALVSLVTIQKWFAKHSNDVVIPWLYRPGGRLAEAMLQRCVERANEWDEM